MGLEQGIHSNAGGLSPRHLQGLDGALACNPDWVRRGWTTRGPPCAGALCGFPVSARELWGLKRVPGAAEGGLGVAGQCLLLLWGPGQGNFSKKDLWLKIFERGEIILGT